MGKESQLDLLGVLVHGETNDFGVDCDFKEGDVGYESCDAKGGIKVSRDIFKQSIEAASGYEIGGNQQFGFSGLSQVWTIDNPSQVEFFNEMRIGRNWFKAVEQTLDREKRKRDSRLVGVNFYPKLRAFRDGEAWAKFYFDGHDDVGKIFEKSMVGARINVNGVFSFRGNLPDLPVLDLKGLEVSKVDDLETFMTDCRVKDLMVFRDNENLNSIMLDQFKSDINDPNTAFVVERSPLGGWIPSLIEANTIIFRGCDDLVHLPNMKGKTIIIEDCPLGGHVPEVIEAETIIFRGCSHFISAGSLIAKNVIIEECRNFSSLKAISSEIEVLVVKGANLSETLDESAIEFFCNLILQGVRVELDPILAEQLKSPEMDSGDEDESKYEEIDFDDLLSGDVRASDVNRDASVNAEEEGSSRWLDVDSLPEVMAPPGYIFGNKEDEDIQGGGESDMDEEVVSDESLMGGGNKESLNFEESSVVYNRSGDPNRDTQRMPLLHLHDLLLLKATMVDEMSPETLPDNTTPQGLAEAHFLAEYEVGKCCDEELKIKLHSVSDGGDDSMEGAEVVEEMSIDEAISKFIKLLGNPANFWGFVNEALEKRYLELVNAVNNMQGLVTTYMDSFRQEFYDMLNGGGTDVTQIFEDQELTGRFRQNLGNEDPNLRFLFGLLEENPIEQKDFVLGEVAKILKVKIDGSESEQQKDNFLNAVKGCLNHQEFIRGIKKLVIEIRKLEQSPTQVIAKLLAKGSANMVPGSMMATIMWALASGVKNGKVNE